MSKRLRAVGAFVVLAVLLFGGFGWAARQALALEERERLAALYQERSEELHRKRLDRAERLRLALWRLDGRLTPALSREDSRPFAHYAALYSPFGAIRSEGQPLAPGTMFLPSPLLTADLPDWMRLHFRYRPRVGWASPQVIPDRLRDQLRRQPLELALHNVTAERKTLLDELNRTFCEPAVSTAWEERGVRINENEVAQQSAPGQILNGSNTYTGVTVVNGGTIIIKQQSQALNGTNPTNSTNPVTSNSSIIINTTNDFLNRADLSQRASRDNKDAYRTDGRNFLEADAPSGKTVTEVQQPVEVELGSMKPVWLPDARTPKHLVLVRSAVLGSEPTYQGVVLDWPALRTLLTEEIVDLFPTAKLVPTVEQSPTAPDRTMSALPVELDPDEPPLPETATAVHPDELPPAGRTPLRVGLGIAAAAATLALAGVALGGWSLWTLSERRMRFVSAVTHELRTPLTTLRLYLDMLNSGMVEDPAQRVSYIRTLGDEAERLHRLIGNVLDFARLENSKPGTHMSVVRVEPFLTSVVERWRDCCTQAGKELVVSASGIGDVSTDPDLLAQVLGNLIDNARKYSQTATDPTITVRALRTSDGVRFEVEDRGPGVRRPERRGIFRPFRRGETADVTAGGVGLGLALASRWTRSLGGRLDVVPGAAGVGACFRVMLPG